MKLSRIGRLSMALVVSVAMGLGMTACGGGTIGFMWVLGTQYNQIAAFKIDASQEQRSQRDFDPSQQQLAIDSGQSSRRIAEF